MGVCYLVGAGDFNVNFTKADGDLLIAADGGYDTLIKHGYMPDAVVGDFDSSAVSDTGGAEKIVFPKEKDETDMYLAYLYGTKMGYRDFVLLGALGGDRLDHTLANITLAARARNDGNSLTIKDDKCEIVAIKNESITLQSNGERYFSVFSFTDLSSGVSIHGAKYDVDGAVLDSSFPLGISNEFSEEAVTVSVDNGMLIIMLIK